MIEGVSACKKLAFYEAITLTPIGNFISNKNNWGGGSNNKKDKGHFGILPAA